MPWNESLPLTLLILVPLLLALGAAGSHKQNPHNAWRLARLSTLAGFLLSVLGLAVGLSGGFTAVSDYWLQASPLSLVMLLLANFIAFVVVRYSATYLNREPREQRFASLVQATFAAVSLAVISNHMLLFLLAWLAISLAMHQLLMFYPERPRAALAAHKKFLFARAAELCCLGAFVLLYSQHGTWNISSLMASYQSPGVDLSVREQFAACLLAQAALIKCAQLPLHGWLIQVVEAPTPVSASLHGGVINMGGYLLLLFAPLVLQSSAAVTFLLVVAGLSCVTAALIMMTRISIKVRLAWSTSAQMGLMLVEIALGLLELALLHLLAHSCYKAYAFLSSGDAVKQDLTRRLAPARSPSIGHWFGAGLMSLALVTGLAALVHYQIKPLNIELFSPWLLLILAMTVLLAERRSVSYSGSLLGYLGIAAGLITVYLLFKSVVASLLPDLDYRASVWADAWMATLFILLFGGYYLQRFCLHKPWVQRFSAYLYAALYLDEWVTRTTLKLWPRPLPERINAKQRQHLPKEGLL